MDRGELALLEKLVGLLQVKDLTPLGLSRQYKAQEKLTSRQIFYVPGDWRCHFFFRVAAIHSSQEEWLSFEARICTASMLNHVRQVHAPHIFTSTCPLTETWLPHLHAIAVDATERFRGILGNFILPSHEWIESKVSSRRLENPSHGPRPSIHCVVKPSDFGG